MKKKQTIEVNGTRILKSLLERWTPLAKECYARGCNCDGCDIHPKLESKEVCEIKTYVRGYILNGVYPDATSDNN